MVSSDSRSRTIRHANIVAVMLLLSFAVAYLTWDAAMLATSTPVQLNYVDGYSVDDMLRLARDGPLYPDISSPPYTVTVYTPAFFAFGAMLIWLGVDGFAAGRLMVLLSMLAIAGVVAWSGWRRTGWVAGLVALILLLQPLQWPWSLVIRPDVPAILLAVLAVLVASVRRDPRGLSIAALLCVAAVFTKQTSLAAPVAILLGLVGSDRRAAARFGSVVVGGFGVCALTLQWISHGQFWFHTVTANANPFSVERSLALYGRFVATNPLVAIALAVLVVTAARRRHLSMVGTYALLACVTAMAAGKVGSSQNYFLEPMVAVALWASQEFPVDWFARRSVARSAAACLATAAVLVLSAGASIDRLKAHDGIRQALPFHTELVRTVAAVPGPVVSDDATLLIRAGKPVHYRPFIMAQLAEAGLWDPSPFLAELERGDVDMIIYRTQPPLLHESRYTEEMRRVMARRYRPAFNYRIGSDFVALKPVVDEPEDSVRADNGR